LDRGAATDYAAPHNQAATERAMGGGGWRGADLVRLQMAWWRMGAAAAEVMWRRNLLAAQGAMTAAEATRMVMEKPAAFADAAMRAAVAASRGAKPAAVVQAGLRPVARKAQANARRLSR
jgi:hypothetical protein